MPMPCKICGRYTWLKSDIFPPSALQKKKQSAQWFGRKIFLYFPFLFSKAVSLVEQHREVPTLADGRANKALSESK